MTPAADIVSLLRDAAASDGDLDAFVEADGRRLSFGAWDRAADGVAAGLVDRGVRAGDVVCLFLPSSLEYMICYQAAVRLGAVVSGVNLRLGTTEVAHLLNIARPRVTVVSDDVAELLAMVPADAGRCVAWNDLEPWSTAPAPPLPALDPRQAMLICWTGGTTGRPRGAWFDHTNLAAVARGTGVLSAPGDRRLSPIPFAHVGTMTRAWDEISRRITTVITASPWTAAGALELLSRERVTVAQGVPTQWELMLRDPTFASTDRSALRLAGIGGAAVSPDLLDRMVRMLGVPVVNRYAATEAGGLISGTRPADPLGIISGTVGRASTGVELRVVDEHGATRATGTIGAVQVRSAAVMRGYWRDDEATGSAIDAAGWLTVGDVGSLDAEGNLTLAGRTGDMYVRGGYNVYPVEVERRISEHELVEQVAVVSIDDPVLGEIGVAAVVPGAREPTLTEVRSWVATTLADYKLPDQLLVVAAMPLTAIGKIDRRALAARAAEERSHGTKGEGR